ncbi:acyl-CoA dehydrogenase family protein [Herbiconiux sp. KACC 21604]|uniref:acyl-CoA dehydrogenase family protein n=1 Tax=unclassified Herbiconiux TaxID=2618217 RepID=UPI001491021D|nr:acyl-CoA dehydrogenase family protein [Herbiconiux sp. SALV-R1]WPO85147.1 acyl-CoA dehydrogenase family protein [Herbiconiux sp. KACC 21604]
MTDTPLDETAFEALKAELDAWVRGPGEAWAERVEAEGDVPPELRDELRERGWLSLAAPVELGGRGIPFSRYLELLEIVSRSHGSIRMLVHVNNGLWRALEPFVDDTQRELLRRSVSGETLIAFTLTEATAGTGSDIRSTVRREGDDYVLNGEKHLITFGVSCDYWLLFARLEGTSAADGSAGTVALLVPNAGLEGVEVIDDSDTMGVRGTDHAVLRFTEARVPVSARVGQEGEGLAVALGGFLLPSRVSVAMSAVGLAERAQELAVEYALTRETFGKRLAERPVIQAYLAENYADIAAARALVLEAARAYEEGRADAGALSSASKIVAVDMLARVTDKALQVHGGQGYWRRNAVERVYRDARAQRFEEGTNEIQKTVVAREVLKRAVAGAAVPATPAAAATAAPAAAAAPATAAPAAAAHPDGARAAHPRKDPA